MAVEVVGRDVRVDRDGRPARQRRQLQLRQLDDDAVVRRQLRQPLDERDPDVAAEHHRMRGIRGEDRGDQRRRRRLALRAGDADRRRRAEAEEQVGLRDEGGPRRVRDERLQSAARSRGSVVGKSGLIDGDVATSAAPAHAEAGSTSGPASDPDRATVERCHRVAQLVDRPAVVDRDVGALVGEEAGEGDAGSGEAQDRDRSTAQRAREHVLEREGVEVDRPVGRHRRAHASLWIEARNSVTPSSPARIPMIQNRSVIFSSSQPASSKW